MTINVFGGTLSLSLPVIISSGTTVVSDSEHTDLLSNDILYTSLIIVRRTSVHHFTTLAM